MSYSFPLEKEQEEMITRSWNTSQKELGHVQLRTKPVDQQFHQTIYSSHTKLVTVMILTFLMMPITFILILHYSQHISV